MQINLFEQVSFYFSIQSLDILPALSKPSFCPINNSLFVCGTEDQDPNKKAQNFLIFSSIDDANVNVRFTCPLPEHLRDIIWIDASNIRNAHFPHY